MRTVSEITITFMFTVSGCSQDYIISDPVIRASVFGTGIGLTEYTVSAVKSFEAVGDLSRCKPSHHARDFDL